jgi:Pentapeptide repeats (8 copies)
MGTPPAIPCRLGRADLSRGDLSGANLYMADLSRAEGWTEEQLDQTWLLDNATMPDGRVLKGFENPGGPTFEEWRKSREGQG